MRKLDFVLDPLLDYHLDLITTRGERGAGLGLKTVRPKEWLRSSATVRVDPGRQTGKSLYIARTADDKDIIICYDSEHLVTMKKRRKIYRLQGSELRVFSISQALKFEGVVQDVWIADASYIAKDIMDNLYSAFAGKCRRFICIG